MRKPRRLPTEQLAPYMLDLPEASPSVKPTEGAVVVPIDWAKLFGNSNPVELEVGFGKGLFLVNAGVSHPERNFLGIEIVRKYQLYATNRIAIRDLKNTKTCCADAKRVLKNHVVPGSLDVVHVFFPDPWWKTRHKKRLLFTEDFARDILKVLKPSGILHFVTDVADYFAMVQETIAAIPGFQELARPNENVPQHDMDYLTNFERKFRKEGRPIHRTRYEKVIADFASPPSILSTVVG